MASQTGNDISLTLMDIGLDLVDLIFDYINDNSNILSTSIDENEANLETEKNRLDNISTGTPTTGQWVEVINARRGYSNLKLSIERAGVLISNRNPTNTDLNYSFWINSNSKEIFILTKDNLNSYQWQKIDRESITNRLNNILFNKTSSDFTFNNNLNELEITGSEDESITGEIADIKLTGAFKITDNTYPFYGRLSSFVGNLWDNRFVKYDKGFTWTGGTLSVVAGRSVCDKFIPSKPNQIYKSTNGNINVFCYDENFNYLGHYSSSFYNTVTTLPNTKYIKLGCSINNVKDLVVLEDKINNQGTYLKESHFHLNDWLGDGDTYENGIINKQWDRVLLSEAYNTLGNTVTLSSVYRFDIKMKESYSGYASTATKYIDVHFKDFIKVVDSSLDSKHIYMLNTEIAYDQIFIFIPKSEIDAFTGTLNDKFEKWLKVNDDYVYYKKVNSYSYKAKPFGYLKFYKDYKSNGGSNYYNKLSIDGNKSAIGTVEISLKNNVNDTSSESIKQLQNCSNEILEKYNTDKLNVYSKKRENKDLRNIFETVSSRNINDELIEKSTLYNLEEGLYRNRKIEIYDINRNIIKTILYKLDYDEDEELISEKLIK